jgi:hypothetical protein
VQLERKRLGYREHLGQVWKFGVVEFINDRLAYEVNGVFIEDVLKIFSGFEDV